ncbi:hypothetical protein NC651_007831 [Populus alba x Populus x berolinensis]|nr:hypothetical protein NC651_007831 [Populus alba x Populus x berolinensis]
MNIGGAALHGFLMPALEYTFLKAGKAMTFDHVLQDQFIVSMFATLFCSISMILNKDFHLIHIALLVKTRSIILQLWRTLLFTGKVSSIESKSNHPMAAALVDYGRWHSIEPKPKDVEEFQNFPGEGIQGKIEEMTTTHRNEEAPGGRTQTQRRQRLVTFLLQKYVRNGFGGESRRRQTSNSGCGSKGTMMGDREEKMHDGNSIVSRDGAIKFEKLISSKIDANMRRWDDSVKMRQCAVSKTPVCLNLVRWSRYLVIDCGLLGNRMYWSCQRFAGKGLVVVREGINTPNAPYLSLQRVEDEREVESPGSLDSRIRKGSLRYIITYIENFY